MKSLLLPLAACAALAGCVSYGNDPFFGGSTVYTQPGYYYGNSGYYNTLPAYRTDIYGTTRGTRDRDGDGIRNRDDIDRDGDGVPNQLDARPNNPRRH